MLGREWRITACQRCWWRDYYTLLNSYPPRCPKCGADVDHEFSIQIDPIPFGLKGKLGRDDGVRLEFKHWSVPTRRATRFGWM